MLVEFGCVVDALRCATEIQKRMAERYSVLPADRQIEFRIGTHQGDIVVEDEDIFGSSLRPPARHPPVSARHDTVSSTNAMP